MPDRATAPDAYRMIFPNMADQPTTGTISKRLPALVSDAREHARSGGRPVLVSIAERVSAVDPLDAIESLASAFGDSDRMYWSRPADDFALAGFGAVVTFQEEGSERFASIDAQWSALRDSAIIEDASENARGVGPVLMGGFAFSPDGPRSARWRDFPSARLILPRVQVVASKGSHWLTLNFLVGADGTTDVELPSLQQLRERAIRPSAGKRSSPSASRARLGTTDVRSAREWRDSVQDALDTIREGRLEKVVLAREVRAKATGDFDVAAAVRQLRASHQTSYVFAIWSGESAFVGASPELLVRVDGSTVRSSSLAGSAARGATPTADARLAQELFDSAKERREHEVVRRSLCSALAEFCDVVAASERPSLHVLPQVQHLHTEVRATLKADHSVLDLVGGLHPTPAVGGEPRGAALRFISEQEGMDRGWYAAPVGWLQCDAGEFAVGLRSALVTRNEATLFAGCGIVADSDPEAEFAESQLKLRPMEMALASSVPADEANPVRATAGGAAR